MPLQGSTRHLAGARRDREHVDQLRSNLFDLLSNCPGRSRSAFRATGWFAAVLKIQEQARFTCIGLLLERASRRQVTPTSSVND
jgi:hypothetical protein